MKHRMSLVIILFFVTSLLAGNEWFRLYQQGKSLMQAKKYELAVNKFYAALQVKGNDLEHVRTYGMHFIAYYPNRELGIAYYFLGQKKRALKFLTKSLRMSATPRARKYFQKLRSDYIANPPKTIIKKEPEKRTQSKMIVGKKTIKLVGERMNLAVLPFDNKGVSKDLGEVVLDKMITALVNKNRFKVIERAQLEKILKEQQLGQSGIIDASTAAQIGKGIGVDGIVIGSVTQSKNGSISIDARMIDTESAAIIEAHDAYSGSGDIQSVKNAIENLANKISEGLPLVEGFVIRVNQDKTVVLDAGRVAGMKRGIKCILYKEGAELKHPITGEVLGRDTKIITEILVTEVFDKYSTARLINTPSNETISIGDKFLTK